MEAHNERFNKLNSAFMDQIKDLAQNGPRAWVRAAATKSQTMIMNDQIINLEKEVKELKSERDKYKTELEKITGARRRLAQSSGSQPSAEVKKNGQALSLKDLADPRKSMEDFWAEQDRKGQ
jgi:dynactin complex subunit